MESNSSKKRNFSDVITGANTDQDYIPSKVEEEEDIEEKEELIFDDEIITIKFEH